MPSEHLTEPQLNQLRNRFPFFDPDRTSAFFSDDQPESGLIRVQGQGDFPGVRMANGVKWFLDREGRPEGRENARGVRPPMKSKAPRGARHLMVDDADAPELLVVEGEGHGIACASVGYRGVVIAGGTQALTSNHGEARSRRENIFRGKTVRILFDTDEAGRAGASRAAQSILAAGAARVAILESPFEPGVDVEDWLLTYPDAEQALGALLGLTDTADWAETQAQLTGEDAPKSSAKPLQSQTIAQGNDRYLAVTVWDRELGEPRLAVFSAQDNVTSGDNSVDHDSVHPGSGWAVFESWSLGDQTYVPDMAGDMMKMIEGGSVTMPAPPVDPGTSEQLWVDVRDFLKRWVWLKEEDYDLLVAYIFMTYRLRDARFDYVPYLRFFGPSSSGKGRALDVMRGVVYRGLSTNPTRNNLHRIVDYYRDSTMIIDEFHIGRGREANDEMVDLLNLGNRRGQMLPRMQSERDGTMSVRTFDLFGPKILASYGIDEHEALARRTVAVDMGDVGEVPRRVKLFALPDEFEDQAYELRARLLGWRGKKFGLGRPAQAERQGRLLDEAGHAVGQVFWPLVEMVPKGLPDALERVMAAARRRAAAVDTARRDGGPAFLVECVAKLWAEGRTWELRAGPPGARLVATRDIADEAGFANATPQVCGELVQTLKQAGLAGHQRLRTEPGGALLSGFLVHPEDPRVVGTMLRYGVVWPPKEEPPDPGL